jgi:hypothetical protein
LAGTNNEWVFSDDNKIINVIKNMYFKYLFLEVIKNEYGHYTLVAFNVYVGK